MTKLAIVEDREEDRYEHITTLKNWRTDPQNGAQVHADVGALAKSVIDGVMKSMSSARQSEVKAWEEEILPCEHTLTLEQLVTGPIPASGTSQPTRGSQHEQMLH